MLMNVGKQRHIVNEDVLGRRGNTILIHKS